ncbi:hypothetical protein L211DRAFT_864397 [Terfezia boudieri ATCC MYA-4762]|uniref:Uncharacterized protein n=1 Tax=Terfezia boudieri ATCC MYA-4762 TaxID=1051890 RepID=A0A3N4MQR2_9PEZI|nr:hypothetical protein L211DRAFT_864397 [Terfezia boudieri ATCC MYA-4762]
MSTQPPPPVEVAVDSNPFTTTLPAEQSLDLRPASAGSESSLHSSTSSDEVVVVHSAKEEEGLAKEEEGPAKEEEVPAKEEEGSAKEEEGSAKEEEGEHVETVAEETPEDNPPKDKPSSGETLVVVAEEYDTLATIVPTLEDTPNRGEPSEEETLEENDGLTPIVPTPEIPEIPEKPTATKVAEAAGHATDTITSWLPGCLAKTSAFVTRLNKLMSTATGTDRALMTTSYSLTALTAQLDRISHYRELAHSNKAHQVSVVPLGYVSYLLLARKQESSRLATISIHLKALASLTSDVRIFMRLWGLFGIYEWLIDTLRNPPKDMTIRKIAYLQIAVNFLYQILENLAYLGQHKVLPIGKKRQNSYWLWSSRFWMAHVVLEFCRLKRERDLDLKGKDKAESGDAPRWYEVAGVMKSDGKKSVWLRQLWSNMAYAPLTVHWSLESGLLTQLTVGTLGTIAGVIGLHQAWRRTV